MKEISYNTTTIRRVKPSILECQPCALLFDHVAVLGQINGSFRLALFEASVLIYFCYNQTSVMKMFEEALIQKFDRACFLTQEYINKIYLPLVILISCKCILCKH